MNDVHNANESNHWGASEFKKNNPDLIVDAEAVWNNRAEWMSYCLDYSRQEVQDYILSSLEDIASKYDVDGFQLDLMRFPRHLSGKNFDEVWEKRHALTHFMGNVRAMLDEIGERRGNKILLSARVPTWVEGCKRLGIDLAE
jgi:1,4-alpha-glucan branching enzyme